MHRINVSLNEDLRLRILVKKKVLNLLRWGIVCPTFLSLSVIFDLSNEQVEQWDGRKETEYNIYRIEADSEAILKHWVHHVSIELKRSNYDEGEMMCRKYDSECKGPYSDKSVAVPISLFDSESKDSQEVNTECNYA